MITVLAILLKNLKLELATDSNKVRIIQNFTLKPFGVIVNASLRK